MSGTLTSQIVPTTFVGSASATVDNTNVVATTHAQIRVMNRHATNTIWVRADGTDATAASGSIPVLPGTTSQPFQVDKDSTTKVSVLGSASNEPFAVIVNPIFYLR